MQNERDQLLSAIAASPADELPRLIYADWLDEHDEAPLAAFVRRTATRTLTPGLQRAYYASGPYYTGQAVDGPRPGEWIDSEFSETFPEISADGGTGLYRWEIRNGKASWRWALTR